MGERYRKEREARDLEQALQIRERKAARLDENPYLDQITLIEQTLTFCKNLVQSKGAEKAEEKKEVVHDIPKDTVLLKKDDEEEFYFAPTKAKKSKSKQKGSKNEGGSKPIKHNAETFRLFDQLKLDAPITTDDIPPLITKLEEKLKSYEEKVEQWKATRDEKKKRIMEGGKVSDDEDDDDKKKAEEEQEEKGNDDEDDGKEEAEEKEEHDDKEEEP